MDHRFANADLVGWHRKVRKRWPKSKVIGEGRYAVLTCAFYHSSARQMIYSDVRMFRTTEDAEAFTKTMYCHAATKGLCMGRHEVLDLENL